MAAFDYCAHIIVVKNTENSDRSIRCARVYIYMKGMCMCMYTLIKEYFEILKNTKADVTEVTNKT